MRSLQKATLAGSLVLVVAAAAPADAGPNFREGQCNGDAGSDPSGACAVRGVGGNVASISSTTTLGFGPGTADREDMYLIFISDPANFSLSVGPGTGFDTQLWLFRAEPRIPMIDGFGLLANDDVSAVDAGAMLGPMSDDGTGISLTTPGLYYLAVSGGSGVLGLPGDGRIPFAAPGPQAVGPLPIFEFLFPTEISGPDGLGGGLPIFDWLGEGEVGSYDIALEGVSFIELEPLCPWDCDSGESIDGTVGIVDFLALLAQWGQVGTPCDFSGDGVGIDAFLQLLANWGPCP